MNFYITSILLHEDLSNCKCEEHGLRKPLLRNRIFIFLLVKEI